MLNPAVDENSKQEVSEGSTQDLRESRSMQTKLHHSKQMIIHPRIELMHICPHNCPLPFAITPSPSLPLKIIRPIQSLSSAYPRTHIMHSHANAVVDEANLDIIPSIDNNSDRHGHVNERTARITRAWYNVE